VKGLRVMFVARRWWPMLGGPEVTLSRLAHGFVRRGATVHVVSFRWQPDWPATFDDQGVHVERLEPAGERLWGQVRQVARLARWLVRQAGRFDVVCASGLRLEAYAALLAARRAKFPAVLRAESSGLEGDCHWQLTALCGRHLKRRCMRAAAFIAPSPGANDELIAAGYPRGRIHSIVPGVPIPSTTWPTGRREARSSLAQTDPRLAVGSGPVVLYVGRLLAKAKGLDDLLIAWRQVIERLPEARLWLVGSGPDGERLQRLAAEMRLGSSVIMPGEFDGAEDFFRAADLFVQPARESRLSISLLEAMSHGLPIVATATLEASRLVADRDQAWLVAPGDPSALADTIVGLAGSDSAAELGRRAHRWAAVEFDAERMVDEHLAVLAGTLDKSLL
jgi:glycosyltransferase involved in cell wall biosynthesis